MDAPHASGSFAVSGPKVVPINRENAFAYPKDAPTLNLHNGRGFVIAIMMSAACWAGVGLALFI